MVSADTASAALLLEYIRLEIMSSSRQPSSQTKTHCNVRGNRLVARIPFI